MSTINGIDPILLNLVKTQTQKPAINEAKKVRVSEDKKDQDAEKRRRQPPPHNLIAAVDKLNKLLQQHKISLYARIIDSHEVVVKVQLIAAVNQAIIAELLPEKVFKLVAEFHTRGFTVNELI